MATLKQYLAPAEKLAWQEAPASGRVSTLAREFEHWKELFYLQSSETREFLEQQAQLILQAFSRQPIRLQFELPAEVRTANNAENTAMRFLIVPEGLRQVVAARWQGRRAWWDIGYAVRQTLTRLCASPSTGMALAAGLLRFVIAQCQVQQVLPDLVTLGASASEQLEPENHPGWNLFDRAGQLLVSSWSEAEKCLELMRVDLQTLQGAVEMAPFIVADPVYQSRRNELYLQLLEQGRKLARVETNNIIQYIQTRNAAGQLNRGLHMHVPYFDDRSMELKTIVIHAIPAGRVMFVPAFIVLACHHERSRIMHEMDLSPSTRKFLVANLQMLEDAFELPDLNLN